MPTQNLARKSVLVSTYTDTSQHCRSCAKAKRDTRKTEQENRLKHLSCTPRIQPRPRLFVDCEGLRLGGMPDDQAECDLVHEVRQIVDEVECGGSDGTTEVAEEVTQGVDGPTDSNDEAHGTDSD